MGNVETQTTRSQAVQLSDQHPSTRLLIRRFGVRVPGAHQQSEPRPAAPRIPGARLRLRHQAWIDRPASNTVDAATIASRRSPPSIRTRRIPPPPMRMPWCSRQEREETRGRERTCSRTRWQSSTGPARSARPSRRPSSRPAPGSTSPVGRKPHSMLSPMPSSRWRRGPHGDRRCPRADVVARPRGPGGGRGRPHRYLLQPRRPR
jgi:hypothetical protein